MKIFKHYGVDVVYQLAYKERFKDFLKVNNIEYIDLPILEDVIQYSKDGITKYAYIVHQGLEEYYEKIYITGQIPVDMSWENLANDIDSQIKGAEPIQLETKAHLLYRTVEEIIKKNTIKTFSFDCLEEEQIDPLDFRLVLGGIGYTVEDILEMDCHDVNINELKRMLE